MFRRLSFSLLVVSLLVVPGFCTVVDADVVLVQQDFSGEGYSYGYRFAGYGDPGNGNVDFTGNTAAPTHAIIAGEAVTDWDMDFDFPEPNDYTYLGLGVGGGINPGDGFLNSANLLDLEVSLDSRLLNVVGSSSAADITVQFYDDGGIVSEYRINNVTLDAAGTTFTNTLTEYTLNAGVDLSAGNIGGIDQVGFSIQATSGAALGQGSVGIRSIVLDNFKITNISAVPEPGSAAVLLTFAVGGLLLRRKR